MLRHAENQSEKIKTHEARNSFHYLCLNMVIKKTKAEVMCFSYPSVEKGLIGSLSLASWSWFGEKSILFQNFVFCRNPLRM